MGRICTVTLLELLDRVGIGPQAAVGAGAHHQMARELVQHIGQVLEDERLPSRRHQSRTPGRAG